MCLVSIAYEWAWLHIHCYGLLAIVMAIFCHVMLRVILINLIKLRCKCSWFISFA